MSKYLALKNWQENISSYNLSTGGNKLVPNVQAKVVLLDSFMQPKTTYIMEGVWINKLGEIQFAYEEGSSSIQECECTFVMQYWYEVGSEQDPLNASGQR